MDEAVLGLVQAIGVPTMVVLFVVLYIRDRGKAENQSELTLAAIAGDSTKQIRDVYIELGQVRQQLGEATGMVKVLSSQLERERADWQKEQLDMKGRIQELSRLIDEQTRVMGKHERRIEELESESKRKDGIIAEQDGKIAELRNENSRLLALVESQNSQISSLSLELDKSKSSEVVEPILVELKEI